MRHGSVAMRARRVRSPCCQNPHEKARARSPLVHLLHRVIGAFTHSGRGEEEEVDMHLWKGFRRMPMMTDAAANCPAAHTGTNALKK